MIEESKIVEYVKYIAAHPTADLYAASQKFLSLIAKSMQAKRLVVPELLQLPPAKRTLVTNIVKSQTNYDIAASRDNFEKFMMFKDIGDTMVTIAPPIIKKIKWLIK